MSPRVSRTGVAAALMLLLPSCLDARTWVERGRPWTQGTIARAEQVRVEQTDGSQLTLEHPRIVGGEQGEFLVGRVHRPAEREIQLDLSAIRTLETREVESGRLAAGIAAGIVVVLAAVLYLFHPFHPSQ